MKNWQRSRVAVQRLVQRLTLGFTILLVCSHASEAAQLNPDGTVDPSGCGGFSFSRSDRTRMRVERALPSLAIATVAAATAWFTKVEMRDAKSRKSRRRWGTVSGVAMATTFAASIFGVARLFLVI